MSKLRVGYILDDSDQSYFLWNLIEAGKKSELYSVEALVIQKLADPPRESRFNRQVAKLRRKGFKKSLQGALFSSIQKAESKWVSRDPRYRDYLGSYPLDLFDGVNKVEISPDVSPSGLVYRYRSDDIAKVRDLGLDVLIRGGSGILRGEILEVCRFGILSFHHGDNDRYRGGPPGFWEVFDRQPSTGFIIQRLSEELDGGDVIFKGHMSTESPYMTNVLKLYSKSYVFLHQMLEQIAENDRLPDTFPKVPYAFPLYVKPDTKEQLRYLARMVGHKALPKLKRARGEIVRWGVAYQFVDDWKGAVLRKSVPIVNPPHRFLADPFVKVFHDRTVVYVEDYDYRSSRGKISAYELTEAGPVELGCALEEEFHLSFPFILEEGGELYMCPETQDAGEIRLYKCIEFPLRWELFKVLMENVRAVDTCIFKHGGRYWMLTNIDSSLSGDASCELHLFYSDRFDSTEWKPHANNPVILDSMSARNGGLIIDGDDIFRVHQVQDFDTYGARMGVAKIVEVSRDTYREEAVCEIAPGFFPHLKGTHTLSFDRGVLLIDFKKKSHIEE